MVRLPQVVPPSWIFFDSRDSEVVAALREAKVGILGTLPSVGWVGVGQLPTWSLILWQEKWSVKGGKPSHLDID